MSYQQNAVLQKIIAQKLVSLVESNTSLNGKKILDVGCGTGFIAQKLLQMSVLPHNITQIDINADNLQHAKQFGNTVEADFNKPILPTQKFDIIFSSMALQWACNFPKTLEYLQNILSKEGSIFFAIPLKGSLGSLYDILKISPFNFVDITQVNHQLLARKQYVENSYIALKNIHASALKCGSGIVISKNQLTTLKTILSQWDVGFFKVCKA